VPSLAITLWLVFAATAPGDALSPPPHGRDADTPSSPSTATPKLPTLPTAPTVGKPIDPKALKSAATPNPPRAAAPIPAAKGAKTPPRLQAIPGSSGEAGDDVVAESPATIRARKRGPRKVALPERDDSQDRRGAWSADRYAAVVPPGLTLAALRNQLAKGPQAASENAAAPVERNRTDPMADIDKAREALRQETARLEALLKAAGNCNVGGGNMPIGEPLLPATSAASSAALREASSEQIDSVSKAMKGMKPEQAAAVIARLDRALAAEILRRMKATDAGAVLGLLKPELAADLATEIAIRKPIYGKDKKGAPK
jgi:flagellar motility protein MotE (MotC chaperone)